MSTRNGLGAGEASKSVGVPAKVWFRPAARLGLIVESAARGRFVDRLRSPIWVMTGWTVPPAWSGSPNRTRPQVKAARLCLNRRQGGGETLWFEGSPVGVPLRDRRARLRRGRRHRLRPHIGIRQPFHTTQAAAASRRGIIARRVSHAASPHRARDRVCGASMGARERCGSGRAGPAPARVEAEVIFVRGLGQPSGPRAHGFR